MSKSAFLTLLLLLASPVKAAPAPGPLDAKANFTADDGSSVTLAKWKGRRAVVAMFYPRCTSACPVILEKLKRIQKQLDASGEKAEFLLVSLDTEEESAKRLSEYREHMELTRENWHFLFGKEKDVRFFSNLVNIRFWRNPKTKDISHDNVILTLGTDGQVIRRLEGLNAPTEKAFEKE